MFVNIILTIFIGVLIARRGRGKKRTEGATAPCRDFVKLFSINVIYNLYLRVL